MEMKEPAGVACNPRISGVELITTDLARACAFYEQGLGFDRVSGARHDGAEIATRRLGKEMLHLVRPDCSGRTYPEPRAANDPWFQHSRLQYPMLPPRSSACRVAHPAACFGGALASSSSSG